MRAEEEALKERLKSVGLQCPGSSLGKAQRERPPHVGISRRGISVIFGSDGIRRSLKRHWFQMESVQIRFSRVIQGPGKLTLLQWGFNCSTRPL